MKTSSAAHILVMQESDTSTFVFGVIGVCFAVAGIVIALLQLRHMARRKMELEINELP